MAFRNWFTEMRGILRRGKTNNVVPTGDVERHNEKRNSRDRERRGADDPIIVYLPSDLPNKIVIEVLNSINNNDTQVGRQTHRFYRLPFDVLTSSIPK